MLDQPNGLETAADLFAKSVTLAIARTLPIAALFDCAGKLKSLNHNQLVPELYKTWIAYNADSELLYAVYFNYGTALAETGDRPGAINALREGIRLNPDFYQPYINIGRNLEDQGHIDAAVAQWMDLVNRLSGVNGDSVTYKLMALQQLGRVFESLFRDSVAESVLKQCLDINPNQPEVVQHWTSLRQRQCKWPVLIEWDRVKRRNLLEGISSLSFANFADDPLFQLAKSYHYNRHTIGIPKGATRLHGLGGALAQRRPGKLRIGYVSSDLRDHAVGFAMTDVVESHDRKDFEIFAYYCGIARTDYTQTRIKNGVDHWIDITTLSDEQAARKIAADGIDILVDLNGYTKDARTKVFAHRPAPVAVNWFGFPGTMGSPYHHYIVADPFIIPEGSEIYYSEKVLRMPCYQPNDRNRIVAANRPSRKDAQLPEDAVVYCCLNGMQKLTLRTFDRWMAILGQVPNSVLWLLTGTDDTNERLRQFAAQRGIAPERIVFAEKMFNPEHLARYPLADLFLDTLPYGAHTTAADAMWMGVPILTLPGRGFAARVCGSVVTAAGLGDLVCKTPEDYVARAIALGRDRPQLAALKQRLVAGRDTCLLFDTPRLVRNLEDLFRQMWKEFESGKLPRPDLVNLDVYHEIGLELDVEDMEMRDEAAYRNVYTEKLAAWNEFYPVAVDSRLWRGAI
jgi:predicted O-linked N-acetylglucosamine transferase (SPINDLY family)